MLPCACLLLAVVPGPPAAAEGKKQTADSVELRSFDVAVRDDLVYLGGTEGLTVFVVADSGEPKAIGRLGLPGTIRAIAFDGDRAYLAAGSHGLFIVDLSEPTHPAILGRFDPPGPVEDVLVRGTTAFLAEDRDGLRVLDVEDPASPRRIARVTTRGQLRALALHEGRLATAEGAAAVRVFDVENRARPQKLVELRSAGGARDVTFAGELLLVAAGHEGLLVFDLDRPRSPVGRSAPLTSAGSVAAEGSTVLVCNRGAGVQILDLSSVDAPRQLAELELPGGYSATRVARNGERLFFAAGLGGLAVAEMADPSAPRVLHPRARTMQIRLR